MGKSLEYEKFGKWFMYFSIVVSILSMYLVVKNNVNVSNISLIPMLAYVVSNVSNIYGGIQSKKMGKDIVFSNYRIRGSALMLISFVISYIM